MLPKSLKQFVQHLLSERSAPSDTNLDELCERLNYKFSNKDLLFQALKHRSYLAYSGEPRTDSNERLELLGDSVLGLVVTEFLFKKYPNETEGILTNYKSLLVSGRLLADVAMEFDLGRYILLNESEARSGGRKRKSILADAVEAIIGAMYLDGGLEDAKKFIHKNITVRLDGLLNNGHLRNNKSLLQEHCQSRGLDGPYYNTEKEEGPDHKKLFTVSVTVNNEKVGYGEGYSKKRAEQKAASEALRYLKLV